MLGIFLGKSILKPMENADLRCKSCGQSLSSVGDFCSHCGNSIEVTKKLVFNTKILSNLERLLLVYLFSNSMIILVKILLNTDCDEISINYSKIAIPSQSITCVDSLGILTRAFLNLPTFSSTGVLVIASVTAVLCLMRLYSLTKQKKSQ